MKGALLVDSGSSKTQWSLLMGEGHNPVRLQTCGLNPLHNSRSALYDQISEVKKALKDYSIETIYFFGAGCATSNIKKELSKLFELVFACKAVTVDSDLTAAGIALFGDKEGIACILGTGSNTGYFTNGKIENQIPALGYILGDEGSGVALGKSLLNAVFKRQLPQDIINIFYEEFQISLSDLIEKVYREPKSAPYIAGFSPFLLKYIDNQDIKLLVENEFDKFFIKNILPYNLSGMNIGMVGSIAYNYRNIIEKSALKYNFRISNVIKEPIFELEKYFNNK